MEAKVKININEGIFEIEGSEQFVSKYMELFKEQLGTRPNAQDNIFHEKVERKKADNSQKKINKPKTSGKPSKVKSVVLEKFDLHEGNGKESLKSFLDSKNARKVTDKIAVIAFYLKEVVGQSSFSEGNIDYAFKMLKIQRPKHLRQVLTNIKNSEDTIEATEDGRWQLTRTGEVRVEDELVNEK